MRQAAAHGKAGRLTRFLRAGRSRERAALRAGQRYALCTQVATGHRRHAGEAGVGQLIRQRGYHVVVTAPHLGRAGGLMPSDGQMGIAPTPRGLRLAGQAEFAGPDAVPDWQRAGILLNHARRMFPGQRGRFRCNCARPVDGQTPLDVNGNPIRTIACGHDLVGLAGVPHPIAPKGHSFFCFRGAALANLVLDRRIAMPLP